MSSLEDVKTEEPSGIKSEEPDNGNHEVSDDVKDVDVGATCSKIEDLDSMFADRYTEQTASYAEILRGFPAAVAIHPWSSHTKRTYDYTNRGRGRGGGGGGWRGGRGGRGGGGGGYYRDRDGGYQGGGSGGHKRRWDGHGSDGDRNSQRVHYPGRY